MSFEEFLSQPIQTLSALVEKALSKGFLDVTVLWRQLYDESVSLDYLRWYNVLIYIAGCAAFLAITGAGKGRGIAGWCSFLLPAEVRRSRSFRIDLQWFALSLLKVPDLITVALVTALSLSAIPALISSLNITLLGGYVAQLPTGVRVVVVYVVALLFFEFGHYWAHRLQHHSKLLWQFHKVHHYSRQLNWLTGARTHPIDAVVAGTFSAIAVGLALSLVTEYDGSSWGQIFSAAREHWWFWPLMVLPLTAGRFGHSHIPISFGWADYIFVSPALHIVHHARDAELHDRNFGGVLSVWDWVFGTAYRHDHRKGLELGITEFGDDHYRHGLQPLTEPFLDAFTIAKGGLSAMWAPRTAK